MKVIEASSKIIPNIGVTFNAIEEFIAKNGGRMNFEKMTTSEVCIKYLQPFCKENDCTYASMLVEREKAAVKRVEEQKIRIAKHRQEKAMARAKAERLAKLRFGKAKIIAPEEEPEEELEILIPYAHTATVYICHSHDSLFLDTFDAIHEKYYVPPKAKLEGDVDADEDEDVENIKIGEEFKEEKQLEKDRLKGEEEEEEEITPVFLWIDIFCLNQYIASEWDVDLKFFVKTWMDFIKESEIIKMDIIMADNIYKNINNNIDLSNSSSSSSNSIHFTCLISTRTWCLYEINYALTNNLEMELLVTNKDRLEIINQLCNDYRDIYQTVDNINIDSNSYTTIKNHKERIITTVNLSADSGKANGLNLRVISYITECINTLLRNSITEIEKELNSNSNSVTKSRIILKSLSAYASIMKDQKKYNESLKYYKRALKILNATGEAYNWIEYYDNEVQSKYWYNQNTGEASWVPPEGSSNEDVAEIYYNVAIVYYKMNNLEKCLENFNNTLPIRLALLNDEHPHIDVHALEGEYDQTIEFYNKVLAVRIKNYGKHHPDVGITYRNMANVYYSNKEYEKALELYHKALKIKLTTLDPMNYEIAGTYNNIAIVYYDLHQYHESLDYYKKALQIKLLRVDKKDNYRDVANTYHTMARIYKKLDDYVSAYDCFKKEIIIIEDKHNDSNVYQIKGVHDITLRDYDEALETKLAEFYKASRNDNNDDEKVKDANNNVHNLRLTWGDLAAVCHKHASYDIALQYYIRDLAITVGQYSSNSTEVATIHASIGNVYYNQRKYEDALEHYGRSLTIRERLLGDFHLDVAASLNYIAATYRSQNKLSDSLTSYFRSLKIRRESLGEGHIDVATIYNGIGNVYDTMALSIMPEDQNNRKKNLNMALEYFNKALQIRLNVLGKIHPHTADILNNMANSFKRQGKHVKSLEYYKDARDVYIQTLGKDHVHVATSNNNMAFVYEILGKFDKALENYNIALEILIKYFHDKHPHVAVTYFGMGNIYRNMNKHDNALKCYELALEIRIKRFTEIHAAVAVIYYHIGQVYMNKKSYTEAFENFEKDLQIKIDDLGLNHRTIILTYNNLARVYESRQMFVKALDYYAKASDISKTLYGDDRGTNKLLDKIEINIDSCRKEMQRVAELNKRDYAKEYREKFGNKIGKNKLSNDGSSVSGNGSINGSITNNSDNHSSHGSISLTGLSISGGSKNELDNEFEDIRSPLGHKDESKEREIEMNAKKESGEEK